MRLLDLFCGAGGAARGYADAGFSEIVGVDIEPQKHYGYEFVQGDALEYLSEHGEDFDAIHASPPCQGYSIMTLNLPWFKGKTYPLLILPTIELLEKVGRPYCLENVMGARHNSASIKKRGLEEHGLKAGWLCGAMFGLPFYRHRLFATNWLWLAPGHPKHQGHVTNGPSPQKKGSNISAQILAHPNPLNSDWRKHHDGTGLNIRSGYETKSLNYPSIINLPIGNSHGKREGSALGSTKGQNGATPGIGHTVGWHLAAEVMGIDWMNRKELTQAIPPVYTEHIGRQMIRYLEVGQ